MKIAFGISWNDSKRGRLVAMAVAALAVSMLAAPLSFASTSSQGSGMVSVIVRELPGAGNGAEAVVAESGGEITRRLEIIDGFSAEVPRSAVNRLEATQGVRSVTLDARVELLTVDGVDQTAYDGSLYNLNKNIKADKLYGVGVTGKGVDVALIDSGVAPVAGLNGPNKVVNGPDLSFEQGDPNVHHMDTYGHGTHLAGIIAGRDVCTGTTADLTSADCFSGVAPEARIVNVKVANAQGATDVSQVIAGIDWVVQHKNDNGMNIRVLNLSFGTDGTQSYLLDPLTYAAEVAWEKGIVVVVSAGNSQFGTNRLNNPAYDPYVIAVGADNTYGSNGTGDDAIPSWSAAGTINRNPDVVAPGKSILSLRVPGSKLDLDHPEARVGTRFFKGSGTSQSAAVVSGAAALLLQRRPGLKPDQVKKLLMDSGRQLPNTSLLAQGKGLIDVSVANSAPEPNYQQNYPEATGTGSLELSRGTVHVEDPNGVKLLGEQDIWGHTWNGSSWSGSSWSGSSWSGGSWSGSSWSGSSWSGGSWNGSSWSGSSWSGSSWSGSSWSGSSWSGSSWSGSSWSGSSWSGSSWSGSSWSGSSWSAANFQ